MKGTARKERIPETPEEGRRILAEGRNCWRIAQADRASFLIDAAAYFEAFASAAESARESILILGWDIDSRGRMLGGIPFRIGRGRRMDSLGRMLRRRGLFAVATVRLVPVAPFTLINLAAGALRIRPLDNALGTLIGMTPGLVAIAFLGERLSQAVRHPGIGSTLALVALAGSLVALAGWLRRRHGDRRETRTSNR